MIKITYEQLEGLVNKNERDQNRFFKENYKLFYNWVKKVINNKEDIEDLTLIIMTKVMNNVKCDEQAIKTFGGWCYRITQNIIIDYLRSRNNNKNKNVNVSIDEIYNIPFDESNIDDFLSLKLFNDKLGATEKQIIELKIAGKNNDVISKELKLTTAKLYLIFDMIKNKYINIINEDDKMIQKLQDHFNNNN